MADKKTNTSSSPPDAGTLAKANHSVTAADISEFGGEHMEDSSSEEICEGQGVYNNSTQEGVASCEPPSQSGSKMDGVLSESRPRYSHDTESDQESQPQCIDSSSLLHVKKDDSGIVMENSPISCSKAAANVSNVDLDILEETVEGAVSCDKVSRPSTSNGSEGVIEDFVDTETDATSICDKGTSCLTDSELTSRLAEGMVGVTDAEGLCGVRMKPVKRRIRDHIRPRSSDSEENDSEENEEQKLASNDLNNTFDLANQSEDNDDDDNESNDSRHSSSESMDHDKTSENEEDDEDDDEMDIDLDLPKDKWFALSEVISREKGYSNRIPASYVFRNKCGASINLVQRLSQYSKLEYHEGCVNSLHFNEHGTLLASGSDDLKIVVWKWLEKKKYFSFESGHRSNVFQSKFMPYTGDTHIVSCARDGQLRLAELSSTGTCKATKRLTQHRGPAHKLALLQDSSHVLYSCGEDAVTMEVDLREDKPHKLATTKENGRKIALYSIHSNPFKSHEYCVSGRDPYVRIFDKRMANQEDNSGLMKKFCPSSIKNSEASNSTNVTCAVYNYNGQEIVGSYNDEDIYLFDSTQSDGSDALHKFQGHRNNATVKGVNFYGPKSEFVVSGSDCGNVFLWEKQSEKVVQYFTGDEGGVVNVLEPHPHLPILATSGLDHDVKVWMPHAKEPTNLEGLKRTMKTNKKERDEERPDPSEAIDSSVFWRLMQHFRRAARQRARQEGEDVSTDTDNSDAHDSDDHTEDSDDEDNPGEPMQCVPS